MDYVGEHLLPGKLGQFFVVLSFAASFVAAVSYFKSTRAALPAEQDSWRKMGRIAFLLNGLCCFVIFGTIYYIVRRHYFEYNFAWEHSGKKLQPKFLLACIWEAQEGSFLLWMMWHAVLGTILMFRSRQWESPVLTVFSVVQFCLGTMILGVYLFGTKIGNSPFLLVRQMFQEAPIFQQADYLSIPQMQDGQNLNALLQNYWMVIHPPVLFLGFASTLVPFAFAIAGLWKKQFGSWTRTALPWTLFSCAILGTGIMMGAAWAYESLTFGGYWAWDPVENASLVPWLVLVAGLHTLVVYNATGHSLRATYVFLILGFILILYSTYLTRSGILGDTSVHAFVESGISLQLQLFIALFLIPSFVLFFINFKAIPHVAKEESTWSREFWMFIGGLVLFLSALFISVATSLPVINKVFGTNWTVGDDPKFSYNRIEIFIAIIVGLLTATVQYLRYKSSDPKKVWQKIWPATVIALALAAAASSFGNIRFEDYGTGYLVAIHLALFAAIYSLVANASYLYTGLKGKFKASGASIAHSGFAILLIGILITSSKTEVLSHNTTGINLPFDPKMKQNPLENLTLIKNVKTDMGKYFATYVSNDSTNDVGNTIYFKVRFESKQTGEVFDVSPDLIKLTKGQEGYSYNPDKRHYWDRDIFAYITYANFVDNQKDTAGFKSYTLSTRDTIFYSEGFMVLDTVLINPTTEKYHFKAGDTALMAKIRIVDRDSTMAVATPALYVKDNQIHHIGDTVFQKNLAFELASVGENKKIIVKVKESGNLVPFIALKALLIPQINLVWLGILIMVFGFAVSIAYRRRQHLSVERAPVGLEKPDGRRTASR